MSNNSKLKGTRIFIGYDTPWKERRTREKIVSEANGQVKRGYRVKVGNNEVTVEDREFFRDERGNRWDKGEVEELEIEDEENSEK